MSVIFGILALAAVPQSATQPASAETAATAAAVETEAVRAARDWLMLHDEGRWSDAWKASASSFRKLNSVERWTEVAKSVRPPLGAVISRTLISQEMVPAPPAGVHVVKFRTRFANKAEAVETVSLARENGAWKMVGIYID